MGTGAAAWSRRVSGGSRLVWSICSRVASASKDDVSDVYVCLAWNVLDTKANANIPNFPLTSGRASLLTTTRTFLCDREDVSASAFSHGDYRELGRRSASTAKDGAGLELSWAD